jgi:hypothetical protein
MNETRPIDFGSIEKVFDGKGQLLDQAYIRRTAKFIE